MRQKGQAVLIILLVIAVALGFGLSIISQSTIDVRIAEHEQEAARAFSAAEAGIEAALQNLSGLTFGQPQSLMVEDIPVEYTVSGEGFLEGVYQENETSQVILGGAVNTLTIEWVESNNPTQNPGNCSGVEATSGQTAASLLVATISQDGTVTWQGINACDLASENDLTNVTGSGSDGYLRQHELAVTASDSLVRIRPVYNQAKIRVTAASPLPQQTYVVESSAQAPTLESKAIRVTRTEPAVPSVFDYVLFSGGSLVK